MVSSVLFCVFSFALALCVQGDMQFVLKNCGNTDFLELKSRTVNPYPIQIPGEETVSGEVVVHQWPAGGKYDLVVDVKSKVTFVWLTVPCVSDVGSCKYDVCSMLAPFNSSGCPSQLRDNQIPCTCESIRPGTYRLNNAKFPIPELSGIWSWLATGDYKITLKLRDHTTKRELACLHTEVTIEDPTSCSGFLCSIFG